MKFRVDHPEDLKSMIHSYYSEEEPVFFNTFHKREGTIDECVQATVDSISENALVSNLRDSESDEPIGYYVKTEVEGKMVMEGFYIRKKFRIPEVLSKFWRLVKLNFGKEFYIGIHLKNMPAIAHLAKNGFEQIGGVESDGKQFILFVNKNLDPCL